MCTCEWCVCVCVCLCLCLCVLGDHRGARRATGVKRRSPRNPRVACRLIPCPVFEGREESRSFHRDLRFQELRNGMFETESPRSVVVVVVASLLCAEIVRHKLIRRIEIITDCEMASLNEFPLTKSPEGREGTSEPEVQTPRPRSRVSWSHTRIPGPIRL